MRKKRDTIQIRIDTEQKEQLFHQAEQMGISPSELIRRLIKMAVHDGTKRITKLEEGERDLRMTVIDILKCLQTMSLKDTWREARPIFENGFLPKILDQELYLQYAKIDRLDLYRKKSE